MGKVLKTVATVASVIALAATGAGAIVGAGTLIAGASLGTIAAAAGATSVVAGSLAGSGRPNIPQSPTQLSRLQARLDTQAPRKMVLGGAGPNPTAFPADIRYYEGSGEDERVIEYIIALAAHKVREISELWIEDELAWSAAGGIAPQFIDYLGVEGYKEGRADNTRAINGGARWGSDDRLTGCAYLYVRVNRLGATENEQSPFANGLPGRVTIVGEGMPMYDPRFDSTRGGSGSMRVDNQNTWGPSSGNPIIQSLNVLLGWRINGKLSVGAGLPAKYINFDSVITAANACDEDIVLSGGGTQPRYRTAGAFSTDDAPMNIVGALLAGCAGDLLDSDGQLSFLIKTNTLAVPAVTFDDHDILSAGRWDPMGGQTNLPNIISGNFTDPSDRSLYQPVPYPSVRLDSEDGIERTASIDFATVENAPQAERLAKQTLQRMQYPGLFSAEYNMKGMAAKVGSIVWQSYSPRGWVNKPFRVVSQKPSRSGRIALVLREEHEDIYAWEAEDSAAVQPAEPVRFDFRNTGPILLAREAAKMADWPRVTDSDGTKPEDNATVGAPNGTPVGDRNAEDVTEAIDQSVVELANLAATNAEISAEVDLHAGQIDDLIETYGSTVSAAASAQSAEDAASAAALAATNTQTALGEAQNAVEAAETARDAAATSATNAAGSATASAGSASAALTSKNAAANSASAANTSKVAAESAATTATDKANAASTSASTAATKATEAGQSASAALTSATNASTSAGNASTSASSASTSATNAAGSANTATTQAGLAATSRTQAGNSATAAASSASAASSSAGAASTSANNAQNSATSAGTSATAASGSATSAASDASAAASSASISAKFAQTSSSPTTIAPNLFTDASAGAPQSVADTVTLFLTDADGPHFRLDIQNEAVLPKHAIPVTAGSVVEVVARLKRFGSGNEAKFRFYVRWLDKDFNTVTITFSSIYDLLVSTPQAFSDRFARPADNSIVYARIAIRKDTDTSTRNVGVFSLTGRDVTAQSAAETQAAISQAQAAIATAQAAAAQTSSVVSARYANSSVQPTAVEARFFVDSWGGNPALLNDTTLPLITEPEFGLGLRIDGEGSYARTRSVLPVLQGSTVHATAVIEQISAAANATVTIAWLDADYNVLSYSFLVAGLALSYTPAAYSYTATAPANKLIRYARLGVRKDVGLSGNVGVYGLTLRDKSLVQPVEASITEMRGAAADSSGNRAAFLKLVAAASGGNPAMFEILASAGGSKIGLVGDVVAIGNSVDGIVETVFRAENGQAVMNDAIFRRARVAPRLGSAILHDVELRPKEFLAGDGDVVQYEGGASYGAVPAKIVPNLTGLAALAAGESYDIRPISITNTQFTARAKKLSAGTNTARTSGAGSSFGSTPQWRTNKPTAEDAYNGDYEFKWNARLSKVNEQWDGGSNYIATYRGSFDLYIYNGTSHEKVGSRTAVVTIASSSGPNPSTRDVSLTEVINSAVDSPSGTSVFGIHPTTDSPSVLAFTSVKYTTQSATTATAVAGLIKWEVFPPRD